MAVDITTETLFSLSELADHWPLLPGGRRLHRSVGYRYVTKGVGPNRVRLEVVRMSGVLFTSTEAVQRFVERLTVEGRVRPVLATKPKAGTYLDEVLGKAA